MEHLRNAFRALGIVAFACCLSASIALAGIAANTKPLLWIYAYDFEFRPGPRFAERLYASQPHQADSCLIISASTAREGLDPAIIQDQMDGVKIFNAATTGGGVAIHETQASILDQFGLHYRCIVAPIHPWLMYDNSSAYPDLENDGYASLMNLKTLTSLSYHKGDAESFKFARVMGRPFHDYAVQINRIFRGKLHALRVRVFNDDLPISAFENYPGELTHASQFLYNDEYVNPADIQRGLASLRFSDKDIFGTEATITSLRRTLELLDARSDRLVVLRMPDNPKYLASATRWAEPAYNDVLREFRDRIIYLDCSRGFKDKEFLDQAHLGSQGRAHLSRDFGRALNSALAGHPVKGAGSCRQIML